MEHGTGKYNFEKEVKYHDGFVLALFPEITGNGFISAGRDNKIFHIDNHGSPIKEYNAHTAAVNSISQVDSSHFFSGSWDGSAKMWDLTTGAIKQNLTGHSHAVTVLALENENIITAS